MAVNIEELPEEAKKALQQFKEFQIAEFKDSDGGVSFINTPLTTY